MCTVWYKGGNWRTRYSKLYYSRRISLPEPEKVHRISFMNKDLKMELLTRIKIAPEDDTSYIDNYYSPSLYSEKSCTGTSSSGQYDTVLLDMVRARYQNPEKPMKKEENAAPTSNCPYNEETCVHGMAYRSTERSISRSRVSRMSTRRDMDIPSILAYTATVNAPMAIEMPEFKVEAKPEVSIPPWSVRRAVCPVCSQKWRDRSSIANIKNSGLKRSSTSDFPRVIAPGRLRSAIIGEYTPRPVIAAIDEDAGIVLGGWRHGNTSWQLTRARRFRILKPQPPLDIQIPATAALGKKDLDNRVHRFLTK